MEMKFVSLGEWRRRKSAEKKSSSGGRGNPEKSQKRGYRFQPLQGKVANPN